MQRNLLFYSFFVFTGALGAIGDPVASRPPVLDDLQSKDLSLRIAAKQRIIADRKSLVAGLIDIVRNAPDEDDGEKSMPGLGSKRSAIEILGEFRAVEAVPALFENLKYKAVVGFGSPDTVADLGKNYPAVGSLIKIGAPAAEQALYRITMSDDKVERRLCCWILHEIHGKKASRDVVKGRLESTQDPEKKKHYNAAVRLLDEDLWSALRE